MLAGRWPAATIFGVDNSKAMLERAAAEPGAIRWIEADVRSWSPGEQPDLIFSNATLHWVEDHRRVVPRLLRFLKAGGCLAVQMPLNRDAPSHRLMHETLENGGPGGGPLGTEELRLAVARNHVQDVDVYYELLADCSTSVDIWTTEYWQVLEGRDPVLEWVKGAGLRPMLHGLNDQEREMFLDEYAR